MFKSMKLQPKLLLIGCLMVIVPQLIISAFTLVQNKKLLNHTVEEMTRLTYADLDHIVQSIHGMVRSHQDVNDMNIKNSLNVARDIVLNNGGFSFGDRTVKWQAINQFTQETSVAELPQMKVGDQWLGQISNAKSSVLVVDKVRELVSVTCTIFQRMNANGDMLRVATNVIKKDGSRAIGTFIPGVNPDGKPNPVVQAVMRGETFVGKAFVVNAMYITAYEPIRDASNTIVGMLYVGVPMESVQSLRQTIMDVVVGDTGYVWVLDSQGNYVISDNGERDGENILNAKDDEGNFFIRDIIRKARELKPGAVTEHRYPWKNAGDTQARMKIAKITYFEPWDWVIGAGSIEEEFLAASTKIKAAALRNTVLLISIFLVSLLVAVWVWTLIARQITRPIITLIDATERMSLGELDITIDITSQDELGALGQAIKRMQTSLKLAMMRIRKEK